MHSSDAVGGGEDPKLAGKSSQEFQRPLGFLTIGWLVAVGMKPQQGDSSDGIPGRGGRILKWFTARSQHAHRFLFAVRRVSGVKKSAGDGIEHAVNHLVGDALRKVEVAEVGGGL